MVCWTHYSTPSISGLAKVGSLFNRRAALPLVRRTEFLVDMSGHLALVLPCLPGLGRGQLLHLRHCLLMPPAQSLPGHGDEGDPLPPASLPSLVHLPGVSSLQCSTSLSSCLHHKPGLERVDDCHVQSSVPPPCPVWDENITRSGLCVWQQGSLLPGGSQTGCLGDHMDGISQAVMPGDPLALVATRYGVVTQDITVVVAGWALARLKQGYMSEQCFD